jgi:uroporphyrinogen decarboxylase
MRKATLKTTMNSHDRILAAVRREEPDHVPLYFAVLGRGQPFDPGYGFSFGNINRFDARYPYSHRNQLQKVEQMLALGADDMVRLEPPLGWAEEYAVEGVAGLRSRVRSLGRDQDGTEILEKTYHTPAGELRAVARITEDWPHGRNIPLFSDFNVSRAREFLIKAREDIPRLKHLLAEPKPEEHRRFKEEAAELRAAARRLGVALEGGRTVLGDSLVWLMGIERLIYGCFDDPGFIAETLELIFAWEQKRLAMLIDEGVQLVFHSAWYEMTDFWTPAKYRDLLLPRLQKLVRMCRQAGVGFAYIITKSYDSLAQELLELGADCLYGADPLQGKADLAFLRDTYQGKVCLWGGLSASVTLGRGSPEEIRAAVDQAVRLLAPGGGFVLFPVDNIMAAANPWERTRVLLDRWREIGSYPISM